MKGCPKRNANWGIRKHINMIQKLMKERHYIFGISTQYIIEDDLTEKLLIVKLQRNAV